MSKPDSLLTAFRTLLTLHRWNFLPKGETWVEAENVAFVTHIAYSIAKTQKDFTQEKITHLLIRSLLKSFHKCKMTDISHQVVKTIYEITKETSEGSCWTQLTKEFADEAYKLFPRKIRLTLRKYIGTREQVPFENFWEDTKQVESEEIEYLVRYSDRMVAYQECSPNRQIYGPEYKPVLEDIHEELKGYKESEEDKERISNWEKIIKIIPEEDYIISPGNSLEYFLSIKKLKYIRRWNRLNRKVPTSVLGHTYIVAILTVIFCLLSKDEIKHYSLEGKEPNDPKTYLDFTYQAILRALFHDLPESFTGDIITPVKDKIKKHKLPKKEVKPEILKVIQNNEQDEFDLVTLIEATMQQKFLDSSPETVRKEIENYHLLEDMKLDETYSVDSLVKYCDYLALLLECIYEKDGRELDSEIETAFHNYKQKLLNSEWSDIREFVCNILLNV